MVVCDDVESSASKYLPVGANFGIFNTMLDHFSSTNYGY
jgi:hypothetical protein